MAHFTAAKAKIRYPGTKRRRRYNGRSAIASQSME